MFLWYRFGSATPHYYTDIPTPHKNLIVHVLKQNEALDSHFNYDTYMSHN